jgi:hypothetical protein
MMMSVDVGGAWDWSDMVLLSGGEMDCEMDVE